MDKNKLARLQANGWVVESAQNFFGLSDAEAAFVELKISLAEAIKALRTKLNLTQAEVANRLHSSQSRVAKMESADRTVAVDLLIQSLLTLGATRTDLAKVVAPSMIEIAAEAPEVPTEPVPTSKRVPFTTSLNRTNTPLVPYQPDHNQPIFITGAKPYITVTGTKPRISLKGKKRGIRVQKGLAV